MISFFFWLAFIHRLTSLALFALASWSGIAMARAEEKRKREYELYKKKYGPIA